MTPERWERVKEAVADALEQPPGERPALLSRALGDAPDLLREAQSIVSEASDETWVEGAAAELSLTRPGSDHSRVGQRVGDYRIVREVGRGGMGAVYLAERADEQFTKQVAIKILKRGTDTEEVLRRFRYEREILARLEHPNIARLLDAGTTEDALPYFAMEYVSGVPITDFASDRELSVTGRIDLFLKVCAAVHFAHRNLIVHRDIKPANVLVTSEGEPKLLDFGIAKVLAPDANTMQLTMQDRQRLTPGYASPEQVRGEAVTTASDIYSLGALLYHLLTGHQPHRFSTPAPSATEMFRVIVEQEPPRASSIVGAELRRTLRGDLDRILETALRKEPESRYSGVTALAGDLRRYVEGRPVQARRPTFSYRASKFIRRNKLGVAAAALLLLSLLAGLGATLWQAQKATVAAARAERRFHDVRELARSVLFDYHDQIALLPGSTEARRRLVQDALKYLDKLMQDAGTDRDLLREVADAYERVAAVQGGTYRMARGVSAANLGDSAGALASQQRALRIREQLANETGSAADREALAKTHNEMAGLYLLSGPPEKAVHHGQNALAIVKPMVSGGAATEEARLMLVTTYLVLGKAYGSPSGPNLGDTRSALENLQSALRLNETLAADRPDDMTYQQGFVVIRNALSQIYSALGDREQELEQNHLAVQAARRIVAARPDDLFYRRELAVQLGNNGSILMAMKDVPRALEHFREALTIYDGLAAGDPNDAGIRRQWAVAHRNLGVAIGASDRATALPHFQKAIGILNEIVAKDPRNTDFRRQVAFTHLAKSRFETEVDDPVAAVASAQEGIRLGQTLADASPGDVAVQRTLALLFTQLGHSHAKAATQAEPSDEARKGEWRRARQAYEEALAFYERLKTSGKLAASDASKPDELTREIAKCDAALAASEDMRPSD